MKQNMVFRLIDKIIVNRLILIATIFFFNPSHSFSQIPSVPFEPTLKPTSPPAAAVPELTEQDKLKLKAKEFYKDAAKEMADKNYDKALAKIDAAEKVVPPDPNLENLRGAAYTEQRNFAKAIEAFTKASELDKKSFSARFNLCEVFFLAKMYPDALSHFLALQADYPGNELVIYKVFLCYLVQNRLSDAEKVLNTLNFGDDFPTYYYAHAAWEFNKGNTKEAQSWLHSAANIYTPQMASLFSDALMELGWIPREGPEVKIIPAGSGEKNKK